MSNTTHHQTAINAILNPDNTTYSVHIRTVSITNRDLEWITEASRRFHERLARLKVHRPYEWMRYMTPEWTTLHIGTHCEGSRFATLARATVVISTRKTVDELRLAEAIQDTVRKYLGTVGRKAPIGSPRQNHSVSYGEWVTDAVSLQKESAQSALRQLGIYEWDLPIADRAKLNKMNAAIA